MHVWYVVYVQLFPGQCLSLRGKQPPLVTVKGEEDKRGKTMAPPLKK